MDEGSMDDKPIGKTPEHITNIEGTEKPFGLPKDNRVPTEPNVEDAGKLLRKNPENKFPEKSDGLQGELPKDEQ